MRDLKWFRSLGKRDFDNGAVIAEIEEVFKYAASKPVVPPANGEQQLQAKIAAIVKETDEECDGDCDSGEILNDLVANLRQLSAVQ